MVLDVRSTIVAVWQKGHSACPSLAPRDPVDEEAPDPVAIFYRPALLSTTPANLCRAGTPARPAAAAYAAATSAVKRGNEEQTGVTTESGAGRSLQLGQTRPGWDGAKSGSGAPDVQNEVFSLQNRVQLGCGAHWQYFQKPECLTAKDGKRSVRQQRRVIWHVQ